MMFLINGQASETLPLTDRGLHYGDGLFETIAIRNGQLQFWSRHMQRLQQGCIRLGLQVPDTDQLLNESKQLLFDTTDAVLKIIITRGSGGRGYQSPAKVNITRIIACYPLPEKASTETTQLHLCKTRLGINPALAGIKHLNRLEQVLARNEFSDENIADGLMLDVNDNVIEGTMSNLFIVKEGQLFTPDLSNVGVAGIIREVVIKLATDNNIAITIRDICLHDIQTADEVFISNSLIGIKRIQQLGNYRYSMSQVTDKIKALFKQYALQDDQYEIV